ncbi:hypothetical protein SDC9_210765 [bioreactor metagenome]|uniref:Uncharacterized protein n=1 Tax=bioreactor metagenome TaxID=1076179 RepID=A0A645JHC2_9ZZZZ
MRYVPSRFPYACIRILHAKWPEDSLSEEINKFLPRYPFDYHLCQGESVIAVNANRTGTML